MKLRWLLLTPEDGLPADPLWANTNAAPLLLWNPGEQRDPERWGQRIAVELREFFLRCWPKSTATAPARPPRWAICLNGPQVLKAEADYLPVMPTMPAGAEGRGKPERTLQRVQGPWASSIDEHARWFKLAFERLRGLLLADGLPGPEMILFDIEGLEYAGPASFQSNGTGQGQTPALDPRAKTVKFNGVETLEEWRAANARTLDGKPMPAYSFAMPGGADPTNWQCNTPANDDARDYGLMPVVLGYLWAIRAGVVEPLRQAFGRAIPCGEWGLGWHGTRDAPVMRGPGGRISYMFDHCPMDVAIPVMYGRPPGEPYYGRDKYIDITDPRFATEQGWRRDYPIAEGSASQCAVRLMHDVARKFLPQVKATGRLVIPSICTPNVRVSDMEVIPEADRAEYMTLMRGMMDEAETANAVDGWWLFEPAYKASAVVRANVLSLCQEKK